MNSLDDLLSSTARVADVTPAALDNGRAALESAVATNIPGVKLVGNYKDALGRTGTAVERDGETLVIDPSNGQLLADISGDPTKGISCGDGCTEYGVSYAYQSEGPAASTP